MSHRTPTLISCLRLGRLAEATTNIHLGAQGFDATAFLLLTLLDEEGPADSAAGLGQMVGLSRQAAHQALERLERDDLVRRAPSREDRRAITWHLEPRGRRWLEFLRGLLGDVEHRLCRAADAGAVERLRDALPPPIRLAGYDG
ncbi:MAG: MarR family transcriptional regulator [Myxococcota bacterium]